MRLLIGGSAHREHRGLVRSELARLHGIRRVGVLIQGGTGGVCAVAEDWARHAGVPVVRYPPNWVRHGKAAEALRNDFMIADARADMVVAFPGGPHTRDLVQRALRAGLAVLEVHPEADPTADGGSTPGRRGPAQAAPAGRRRLADTAASATVSS